MSLEQLARGFAKAKVLRDIEDEVDRQEVLWGHQQHNNGTGATLDKLEADEAKAWNDEAVKRNQLTWRGILHEEVAEAFAEKDHERLREELVQVAAVATSWLIDMDTRN
jgi:hypothetical protein